MKVDWKHIFNWEIESVSEPYIVHMPQVYVPIYSVDINYKYHGSRRKVFATDVDSGNSSLDEAREYIKRIMANNKGKTL